MQVHHWTHTWISGAEKVDVNDQVELHVVNDVELHLRRAKRGTPSEPSEQPVVEDDNHANGKPVNTSNPVAAAAKGKGWVYHAGKWVFM